MEFTDSLKTLFMDTARLKNWDQADNGARNDNSAGAG